MRNILEMSVSDGAVWAEEHPKEMQIIAQSYGICADISETGMYCTLSVGHVSQHQAMRADGSLIQSWGQGQVSGWMEMKES